MFAPNFTLTPKILRALMAIEADRQIVASIPLAPPMLEALRRTARLLATHLSTQIEGNRLTRDQVRAVVEGEGNFPGRERDEAEVKNYFAALEFVEQLSRKKSNLTERTVQTIHGWVMLGKGKPSPYRRGQNVIRDQRSGRTVYLPPEAKDVPGLMAELIRWVNANVRSREWPVPVIAGLAHYQFATIHPYFDGNGRTARILTNLLMHRGGYGLNGIYSLEEYYAANLEGYYAGLSVGPSHNYYFGRAKADVTPFLEYFLSGMSEAFGKVRGRAEEFRGHGDTWADSELRQLSPQQRYALGLFRKQVAVTSREIASFFSLTPRAATALCRKWVASGFLRIDNPSTKARSFRLAPRFEQTLRND